MESINPFFIYTVFDCIDHFPCDECENNNCITSPNKPRKSLNGKQAIATGIFKNAPNAQFLTQEQAEKLMETREWADPEEMPYDVSKSF